MTETKESIKLEVYPKFKISDLVQFKNKINSPHSLLYQRDDVNPRYFVEGVRIISELTSYNNEKECLQKIEYLLIGESEIDISDEMPLNDFLSVTEDQLEKAELTDNELRKFSEEFDLLVKQKHYWVWRQDVMDLINLMLELLPNLSNQEIYDRVGETFVDWDTQAIKDDKDWHEALDEIASDRDLLPHEKQQLKNYLSCDF